MDETPWTQDAEQSFLNDPISYLGQENFDKLCKIRDLKDYNSGVESSFHLVAVIVLTLNILLDADNLREMIFLD